MSKVLDEELPEGWVLTNLDSIGSWGSGGTPSRKIDSYFGGDIPWVKTGDLGDKVLTKTTEFITELAVKNSSAKLFPIGSVIFAMYGATIGKTSILGIDATTNQACAVIQPINGFVKTEFIYYLLINEKTNLIAKAQGGAQPNISQSIIKQHQIFLPSSTEQEEIAKRLDILLKHVDEIKSRIDGIPKILKDFRQSVLCAAVSGKLTEDWRKINKSNKTTTQIRQEIEQYRYESWKESQILKYALKNKVPKNNTWEKKYTAPLNNYESKAELPDGWVYEQLDGLVYIAARIGWKGLTASEYTKTGPLFLSVHSLNHGECVELQNTYHISQERYDESPEIQLKNDDILLCKDGAGIGKTAIIKELNMPATVNSSLLILRAGKYFNYKYLYYFLTGPTMQALVKERILGTAIPHLFQRDIKQFVLEIPPLEEQTEIVRRVEEYFKLADSIEAKIKAAQVHINFLTQSILYQAFKGNLTKDWRAENHALISGENSAERLLERIKTEKGKRT